MITLKLTSEQLKMINRSLTHSHLYDKLCPKNNEWDYLLNEIKRLHHIASSEWPNKPLGTVKF